MNSINLETEIREHLLKDRPPSFIASILIDFFKNNSHWTQEDLYSFSVFLIKSGFYVTIVELHANLMKKHSDKIPWRLFIEGLGRSKAELSSRELETLVKTLRVEKKMDDACLSEAMDHIIPQLKSHRETLKVKEKYHFEESKNKEFDLVDTYRAQQLFNKELEQIQNLIKKYPEDDRARRLLTDYKERHAIEVFNKRRNSSQKKTKSIKQPDRIQNEISPEISNIDELNEELLATLAHSFFLMDDFQGTLKIIHYSKNKFNNVKASILWLEIETLLKLDSFLEVLHLINEIEVALNSDPDTFLAASYYKAQAYWGLDQKKRALEVLEGIMSLNPHYRSTETLLATWQEQL